MDQRTADELAAGGCGLLRLGSECLVVSAPDDADFGTLAGELRRLAKAKAKHPLAALAEVYDALPPALRDQAVKAAVAQGGREAVEPTNEQMAAAIYDAEGARFWVWWLARKHKPDLTLEDVSRLVTEANVTEVLARLGEVTKLARMEKNSTGHPSSRDGSPSPAPSTTAI